MPRFQKAKRDPVTEDDIKEAGMQPRVGKPRIRTCIECGEVRPIHAKDLCERCYPKVLRRGKFEDALAGESRPPPKLRIPGEGDLALDSDELIRNMTELNPLSPAEEDRIAIQSAAGGAPSPTLAEKPTIGHQKAWAFLRRYDHYFRRQIIRKMQSLGMGRLEIIAAFVSTQSLRKRWIDPLPNPIGVLNADFTLLAKTPRDKRTTGAALRDYIERLMLFQRIALDLASSGSNAAVIRKEMLVQGAKLAREIAILEDAIRVDPGSGDQVSPKARADLRKESRGAKGEESEDEEEETPGGDSGYELPQIE